MNTSNQSVLAPVQEEVTNVSIGVQTEETIKVKRKLDLDKSIFTPPSELRKQINYLSNELSEAYEFHDLELQVLKEELQVNNAESTETKNIHDLEKSLRDAEEIILEANKEISNLKTVNQDLIKDLEEESVKYAALKAEYEDEISKLHTNMNKKDLEIESLKKDKDDFDFRLELIIENYNMRISELKSALENKNEQENLQGKNELIDELQRRLNEENEKTVELSKKLEDLNLELLSTKETVKSLEEQLAENNSGRDRSHSRRNTLQTEEIAETISNDCSTPLNFRFNESIDLVNEVSLNFLFGNETREEIANENEKLEKELAGVCVQTVEIEASSKNSDETIEEIRSSFQKEIKELKDEHNMKLKALECSNESLNQINLSLTEKLEAANNFIEELKEKLHSSTENVDSLSVQIKGMKASETQTVGNEIAEYKIKELESENDELKQKILSMNEDLKLAKHEVEELKETHEKLLQEMNLDWESRIEELKLEKEKINSIVADKDKELGFVIAELNEAKIALEEREINLKAYIDENCVHIDLLMTEKAELENWIKSKEEEMNNLNAVVEEKLTELRIDSDLNVKQLKEKYENEIKILKCDNEKLSEEIESIRSTYESEILNLANLIEDRKTEKISEIMIDQVDRDSVDNDSSGTIIGECITDIKTEKYSIFDMFSSQLAENSISLTENIKPENESNTSTVIQEPSEILPLVPVQFQNGYSNETVASYNLHTMDEEKMQLRVNSESTMLEFVNEFAKLMLRENIIHPEELKTTTNIFYVLFNKYLILLEMYSRLKIEFDEYKLREQKERADIVNRTVRYLDTLCSQLEVSGSSLNLSNTSLISFREGLPSSTIVEEDCSEAEISAMNDSTVMIDEKIAKLESLTMDLQQHTESIAKESVVLKESLIKSTEEIGDIKNKLILEIISLNPQLEGTFCDMSVVDLISVFQNVIIENCKRLSEDLNAELVAEMKTLKEENEICNGRIKQLANEIDSLRKDKQALLEEKEMIEKAILDQNDDIVSLREKNAQFEELKSKIEDLEEKLAENDGILKSQISLKENALKDLDSFKLFFEEFEKEKSAINKITTNLEERIAKFEDMSAELQHHRENLIKESANLKESLIKSREEISDIKDKLIVEILSLNPELEGIFCDMSVTDLISLLQNTVTENCKMISDEASQKVESELRDLREKNENCECRISDLNGEIDSLKSIIAESQKEKDKIEKAFSDQNDDIARLTEENKDLREKLTEKENDLSSEISMRENALRDLENMKLFFEEIEKEKSEFGKITLGLEERIAKFEALSIKLQNEKETLHKDKTDLTESLTKASSEISAIRDKLIIEAISLNPELEDTVSELSAIDLLSLFLNTIMDSCKKMPEELAEKIMSDLKELKEKSEMCEVQNNQLTKEVDSLKYMNTVLTEEKDMLQKAILDRNDDIVSLREENSELKGLKAKIAALEEKIAENNSALQTEIYVKENTLKDLQKFKTFFEEVEKSNSSLKQQLEQSYQTTHQLKMELNIAKKDQMNSEMKVDELMKEVDELQQTIEMVNNDIKSLENKLEEAISDSHSKTETIRQLSAQLDEAKEKALPQEEIIEGLRRKIEEIENERKEFMKSELVKHEEKNENMVEEIELLKGKIASSETDLTDKIQEVEKLSAELKEAKELNVQNEETIKRHLEELRNSTAKLEEMESELGKQKEVEETLQSKLAELASAAGKQKEVEEILQSKLQEMVSAAEKQKEVKEALQSKLEDMESAADEQKIVNEAIQSKLQEMEFAMEKQKDAEKILQSKLEEMESEVGKQKEIEEALQLKLEEMVLAVEKQKEVEEAIQSKLEEMVSAAEKQKEVEVALQSKLEEMVSAAEKQKEVEVALQLKLEEMETAADKQKEVEEAMQSKLEFVENEVMKYKEAETEIQLKLTRSEEELENNMKKLSEITDLMEKTNEMKIKDEELIMSLKVQVQEMEEDRTRLTELASTVAELREVEERLTEKIEDLKCKLEKSETENGDLISKLKESEEEKIRSDDVIKTLQQEVDELRSENLKIQHLEESEKLKLVELEELKLKMSSIETDLLEKTNIIDKLSIQLEEAERTIAAKEETISALRDEVEELRADVESVRNELKIAREVQSEKEVKLEELTERMNDLLSDHSQEVDALQSELRTARETSLNLKAELDQLSAKVVSDSEKLEITTPLKTPNAKKYKTAESPSFISRRLEKLENLNDLLTGTLQKIITALEIPFEGNLFSVGHYESSEAEIMKHISVLSWKRKSRNSSESDCTLDEFQDLSKTIEQLRNGLSSVARHVGLAEGKSDAHAIINRIDKMISDVKKEFIERIDVLRQDNQHLDDDNSLLQSEMKKLVEENEANHLKISNMTETIESLRAEVEALSKIKLNRKTNLCNRKLDKLEEMHQLVIDLMKKMLGLTGMENLPKLNLSTSRTFEIESKKVWDHFNGWVASKTKELEELKSQLRELDEECDSYAKVITESRQENEKLWMNSRSELKNLEDQISQLQQENKTLKSENEKTMKMLQTLKGGGDIKNSLKKESEQTEELKRQNQELQAQIKQLETNISESKKQIEELDEECESYSKVIIEARQENEKLWMNSRSELKNLEDQISQLQQENKALKSENEKILKKLESGDLKASLRIDNEQTEELKKQNLSLEAQIKQLETSLSESKKQVEELDEECESYAKVIKENQKEILLCEENKNEIKSLKEQLEKMEKAKKCLQEERDALREKISLLESSNKHNNAVSNENRREGKEVKELRRTVALREMKILELEQLNEKNIIHKSQIQYLENSVAALKEQLTQETTKNQKLLREVNELTARVKLTKKSDGIDLLDQLKSRESLGIVATQQIDGKEKLQKLEKDNKMLKEICRTHYNEIKRLETENRTLRGGQDKATKNSNQMDSPIRTRCYNMRNKKY